MTGTKNDTLNYLKSTAVSVQRYFLFSSLALIIIFAWMKPAGAAGIGFGKGLVFWTIQISILIPLLIVTQHFISHLIKIRVSHAPWVQTALSGVVGALLFVPIGYLLDVYFGIPDDVASGDVMLGLIDEAAGVIVPVTTTWLALNAPWIFQLDFSNRPYEAAVNARMTQEPVSTEKKLPSQFLQELRSRAPGDLISISSELHYLRVTTTEAEVMFLYNLKDAIGELPLNSGVQIHRSHWVSKDHVKKLSKKDGNAECLLSNGKSLPVSRRKHSEVKDLLATKA